MSLKSKNTEKKTFELVAIRESKDVHQYLIFPVHATLLAAVLCRSKRSGLPPGLKISILAISQPYSLEE
jgi:hypothetical protein